MRGALTLNKLKSDEVKKMSFEDIFLSPDYANDLRNLMHTACLRVGYKKPVSLMLSNNPEDSDIAYTDGNRIYVNLGMKFGSRLKQTPVLFHIFVVGLIAHELGHVFWTEFDDGERFIKKIKSGVIYPSVPNHPNAQKYVDALKVPSNRAIFCQMLHSLDNILEDIYVNALQAEMLGGLYSKGIDIGNIMITEEMKSIEEQKKDNYFDFNIIMNCLITKLKSGTVIYSKYESEFYDVVEQIADIANKYIFLATHKERAEGINMIICELWDYVEDMLNNIKQQSSQGGSQGGSQGKKSDASKNGGNCSQNSCGNGSQGNTNNSPQNSDGNGSQSDSSNKSKNGNTSQSTTKNGNNGSGDESNTSSMNSDSDEAQSGSEKNGDDDSNGASSGGVSEEDIDMDTLQEILKRVVGQLQGKTQESLNQNTSSIAGKNAVMVPSSQEEKAELNLPVEQKQRFPVSTGEAIMSDGDGSVSVNRNITPETLLASKTLREIVDKIATEKAEEKNEFQANKDMVDEINAMDFGPIHKGISKTIHRVGYTLNSKSRYEYLLKDVLPIVNKLVKVIERTIKEENLSGERRSLYYGKKLDNQRLYRPDYRVWKDRKKPKKEIDCVFSILVDISGSMYGTKIDISRLVAIMFAEACEKLGIPLEITGHTTPYGRNGIELYSFLSFDSLNKKDKYSLSYMSAQNCNRDGAALIYSLERLMKRPELKKVFFIISDGQPNDNGYYGETAKSDMKNIKNKYSKEGVVFVAAAIDSDKEFIKEIYGKNFLNISFLDSMPQTFGKILQNAVLD